MNSRLGTVVAAAACAALVTSCSGTPAAVESGLSTGGAAAPIEDAYCQIGYEGWAAYDSLLGHESAASAENPLTGEPGDLAAFNREGALAASDADVAIERYTQARANIVNLPFDEVWKGGTLVISDGDAVAMFDDTLDLLTTWQRPNALLMANAESFDEYDQASFSLLTAADPATVGLLTAQAGQVSSYQIARCGHLDNPATSTIAVDHRPEDNDG